MTSRDSKVVGSQQMARAISLVLLAFLASVAAAGEPPIAYRRILVPADRPSTWPQEGATFLPVESRDFDAWVAAANQPPSTANIAAARYEVRLVDNELDEDELVGGRGSWHVELRGNRPALIRLENTSFAFHNARWRGGPAEPARLGWWPSGDGKSLTYALEVPRSGELDFDWQLPAAAIAAPLPEFPIRLPVAARTELALDVPSGRLPLVDGGLLRESPPRPDNGGRWVFALRPAASPVLRFEYSAAVPNKASITTALREDLNYVVSKRGIELRADLRLANASSGHQQLDVALPANWRLIEAAVGDQQLTWHTTAAEKAADPARVTIQLPDDPKNRPTTVRLRAWRSHSVGELLRLPMLAVNDAFWTSGNIQLTLDDSLELNKLAPVDCVQSAADSDGNAGEVPSELGGSLSFAAFTPSAAVEVALTHRPVAGHVTMGTTLDVGNPNVAGRLVADVSVERGTLHQLRADLQPGWTVDAVETVPATALGEWYVDREVQSQAFELQLNRAVTPNQPVRVVITGRLERPASLEPLPLIELNPLSWRGLLVSRNLLQLRAAEQFDLEPAGDLQYLEASGLTAPERTLLTDPLAGRICDSAANRPDAAIRLAPKKGAYDATVQLDSALCQGRLQQTYRVECRPRGSGTDHVLVFLSEPAPEPLRWIEVHSNEPLVAQRMPPSDPRLRGLPPGGELWLLDLHRLYVRNIALSATWSSPWTDRRRVPLVSLPDASTQQGRVTVASGGAELPTIVAQGMSPAPLPMVPLNSEVGNTPLATRAVYRFQPTRFYDADRAAELWIGPSTADPDDTHVLATHVEVESRFSADGGGVHRVSYQLQNMGANSLELTLPHDVRLEAASLDGQPVGDTAKAKFTVPLSSRQSEAVLDLELSSRYPPLAGGDQLPSPLPTGPLTILDSQWSISLPHGFATLDTIDGATTTRLDWRQRLFGPLARPQSDRRFNPLIGQDWNLLWADLSRAVTTPAQAQTNSPKSEPPLPTGWDAFRVDFVAGPPAAITLAHRPATAAVALAIFLFCAVGAPVFGLRRLTVVLFVLATAACSLFLPVLYVPCATAATLGFGAAVLWQWSRKLIDKSRPAVALLATLMVVASVSADAPPPSAAVERVLIPVDSAGKPAGTKYFVSTDFLRHLMGAATKTPTDRTWLITDMRCDGELVPRQEQAGLRAGSWMLAFEIETFARDAVVELPLVRHEADWSPSASLDGMPAPIDWDASGRGCRVRIAEPGPSRLTLSFVPRLDEAGGRQQLTLSLPQIAGANLSIAAPATLTDLQSNSIAFSRRDGPNRTVWLSTLNSEGRMTASWRASLVTAAADPNRRVDELCALRIRPDGIILDVTFLLSNVADWPSTIDVAVDDGWVPLSVPVTPPAGDLDRLPDGRHVFRFRPTPATHNDRKFTLRFRAPDSSTLGRIRLPNVELLSPKAENRWFAVWWDPAFNCLPSIPHAADANPPAGFANEWGANGVPAPQILLDADSLDANWFLHVRPRAELSTCRDLLSLAAGNDQFRVDYRADVSPQGADCFGWSLSVPIALTVQSLTATIDGATIPLDWARATPDRLNAFFARATSRPYRLHLVGSLPSAASGRTRLPRITSAGQPQSIQTVALYRDSNVLAKWQFANEVSSPEDGATQSPPFGNDSHFVRAHKIDSQSIADVHIAVEPNQPVVSGKTLTRVSRENDVWSATFQCDLQVERGELDSLRLQIPSNWTGPFAVTPAAKANVVASGRSDGKATLAIQLPQSARPGGAVRLQVRSPLALAEGEMPAAPQIVLLHPGSRESFLALPTSFEGDPADWTQRGIERAELPRGSRSNLPSPLGDATFRITADSINVALRPRGNRASSASIRLAETAVHVGPANGMLTLTRYVLAPEGLDQCVVKLPAGERLVQITLDGHPALARQLDPRRVHVQLGPPNLPQALDVVTRTVDRTQNLSQMAEMRRPVLEQSGQAIPVEFGLWTLFRAPRGATARITGGARVTPAELAAARLDRMVSISQTATRAVIESPVVDGYSWFSHWVLGLENIERVANSLQRSATGSTEAIRVPQTVDPVPDAVARSDAWIEQIAEIFAAMDWTTSPSQPTGTSSLDPWRDARALTVDRVCFISDGNENDALVEFVPDGMTTGQTRFVLLATFAAVAAAAVWLVRNPPALQFAENWPEATGLMMGLLAWAWLQPSIVGLVVAAVSLVLLARRIVHERKSPRHDSSNQPNSIPEEVAKH